MEKFKQAGMSLVQVLLLIGALAGTGVVVMQNQQQATKLSTKNTFNRDVETVAERIKIALVNRDACSRTIQPLQSTGVINRIWYYNEQSANTDKLEPLFNVGEFLPNYGTLKIEKIFLKKSAVTEIAPITLTAALTQSSVLSVTFVDEGRTTNSTAGNSKKKIGRFTKTFKTSITKTASGNFECISDPTGVVDSLGETSCTNFGSTYDPSTKKCKMNQLPNCIFVKASAGCTTGYKQQESGYNVLARSVNYKRKCTNQFWEGGLVQQPHYTSGYFTSSTKPSDRYDPGKSGINGVYVYEGTKCEDAHETAASFNLIRCCQENLAAIAPPPADEDDGPDGPTCFVAGTLIRMESGEKKAIEDVIKGDRLLDSYGKGVVVKKLTRYPHKGQIYSINGGEYFFTANHPFLVLSPDHGRVWKSLNPKVSMEESKVPVSLMQVGDLLVKEDGLEMLYTLDSIPFEGVVYNFTVSDGHEYIANDYVVHNLKNQNIHNNDP